MADLPPEPQLDPQPLESLQSLPSWTPRAAELDGLEMLLSGAYAPLTQLMTQADAESVQEAGRLSDGSPWPTVVTMVTSEQVAAEAGAAGQLVVRDEEGTPVAAVEVTAWWADADGAHVAGPARPVRPFTHGTFAALRRTPAQVRASLRPGAVLGVPLDAPMHAGQVTALRHLADELAAKVLLLPLVGAGAPRGVSADGLVRIAIDVSDALGDDAALAAVPLPRQDAADRFPALCARVAATYGATHVLTGRSEPSTERVGATRLALPETCYDVAAQRWRPTADVKPANRLAPLDEREIAERLDAGDGLPAWMFPATAIRELRMHHRPLTERGITLLFTGLSGSGKSTVARALHERLLERGDRRVTMLDGDRVRLLLSSELTFSKEHRDLNVRRIGYVAAEVARHGGVAICAPIAPYAAARNDVCDMVTAAGGTLVLIHVATPLEECERRDRKGLYAKARAGLIPSFTGVSDPYEAPTDADLTIDTTDVPVTDAVATVEQHLVGRGFLARDIAGSGAPSVDGAP